MLRLKFENEKLDTVLSGENTEEEEDKAEEREDKLDPFSKEKKKNSDNREEKDSYPIYQDYMSALEAWVRRLLVGMMRVVSRTKKAKENKCSYNSTSLSPALN
jgi:hypothetical protein